MSCTHHSPHAPRSAYQLGAAHLAPGAFADALALLAQHAVAAATSAADRQLCYDLRRRDGRYQFRSVDRMLDLVAHLPEAKFEAALAAFTDHVRAHLLRRRIRRHLRPVPDLLTALAAETATDGRFDDCQVAAAREMVTLHAVRRETLEAAIRAGQHEIAGVRRFMDALAGVPVVEGAE